jgi:hypothetical protein
MKMSSVVVVTDDEIPTNAMLFGRSVKPEEWEKGWYVLENGTVVRGRFDFFWQANQYKQMIEMESK